LAGYIHQHATVYDPSTDAYDVTAFDRDISVDKAVPPKAIYDMHSYWSKKHWAAIREYIHHYLPDKHYPRGAGLVIDSFSGSGMTGVAAMMEGRPCVLIDASPAAAFISHCYTHPVDPEDLQAAFEGMLTAPLPADLKHKLKKATGEEIHTLQEELDWLYATRCDRCGGDATTEYIVYSERFQCPNCAEIVALFDCPQEKVPYVVGGKKSGKVELKKRTVCPHCLARASGKPHRDFAITTRGERFGPVPVMVRYRCLSGCKPAAEDRLRSADRRSKRARFFEDHDMAKIRAIETASMPHWHPKADLWKRLPYRLGHKKDFRPETARLFEDLYTKRNLWALAAIKAAISRAMVERPLAEAWEIAMTAVSLNASRMYQFRPSRKGGFAKGTYYIPQVSQVMRASSQFEDKRADVLKAEEALTEMQRSIVLTSNQLAIDAVLPANTIDYVFSDPPYVDKLQYGELNFVWEAWLGFDDGWLKNEIVVNPYRDKSLDDWDRDMRKVLANLYQALKPARWLSLCYHDTDPGTWARVQDMLLDTGFEIHTVTVLDPLQKSINQITAEKVAKGDLVVNCRKPRPGEPGRAERDEAGLVSQRVRDVLVEVLGQTGGQTRERLWDIVLKRLLARGQLAEHRFDDVLGEVAFRSESGRWFLKEEFESLSDNDVKNEEQAGGGLTAFARLRMAGVPAALAAEVTLHAPHIAGDGFDEDAVERYIRRNLLKGRVEADKFKLGGRMKGVEFYDCLFFYLTRWLKGRTGGKTPRRNLAEFLDEYLVRFKDSDKWLYRIPDDAEALALKKARQTGLGRRIRQYVAFLNGEGEYPPERRPDVKTLYIWLKHCANFGLPDEGVALWEKGGIAAQLNELQEEQRYDADDYYAQCRRRVARAAITVDEEEQEAERDEE